MTIAKRDTFGVALFLLRIRVSETKEFALGARREEFLRPRRR